MQSPLHNGKSTQTWFPWCLRPIVTIQHLSTQSTVLTNSSVLLTSVVYGNEDENRNKTCWIKSLCLICLLVPLNAKVLVVVIVVGCVRGSWSQVSTSRCYIHCLPLTQNASKGVSKKFKNLCCNKVCFAKTVSPAPLWVRILGSHHPGTRLHIVPGFRDPGSYWYWGRGHSMATYT